MVEPPSATGVVGINVIMWYENATSIPGEPTIDEHSPLRTTKNCKNLGPLCKKTNPIGESLCCVGAAGLPPGVGVDTTRKTPWRAPGSAHITSPCGIEGGNPEGCPKGNPFRTGCQSGGFGHGRDGRTLLATAPTTTWRAGSTATVKFNLHNNHGGGYSFRL